MENHQTQVCAICGHKATVVKTDLPGYIQGPVFQVFHCSNCDTNFIGNRDTDIDVYQHIYLNPELTPGYNRYFHYATAVGRSSDPWKYLQEQEAMYWAVGEVLREFPPAAGETILEVGCGLGYLTYSLNKAGYTARGLDISQNAVDSARKRFGDYYEQGDIFELSAGGQAKFRFIVLTEVIEHVSMPREFIEALSRMLLPGGRILVTTPNKSVGDTANPWSTELPPVHLWWFSKRSMEIMGALAGCNVSSVDFTPFNKRHFDKMRFKVYKPHRFVPTLRPDGSLIDPKPFTEPSPGLEGAVWKMMLKASNLPVFHQLLTRPEYPITESSTLACVFTPQV